MYANCKTPLGVTLLMEAHYSPEPLGNGSPADLKIIEHLLKNGLIERVDTGYYRTTDKGAFHVEALCQLPFPVAKWETPRSD